MTAPSPKGLAFAIVLLGGLALAAILRLPLLGASPLQHDVALMLATAQKVVLGQGGIPFGETCIYRPMILLLTSGLLALMGGPVTPEKAHLAASLVSLTLTGFTVAMVGLWLHFRCRLRLDLVLAGLFCLLALPGILPFAAEGLQTGPALFFGTAAFLAADLAALRAGRPGAVKLTILMAVLLLLMFLSRDTFAVIAFPCALRLLQANRDRWRLLLTACAAGIGTTVIWLTLEALLFHPDHSLLELVPTRGMMLNQNPARLLQPVAWARVGGILAVAGAYGPAALALVGLFRREEWGPPRLALLVLLLLFTALQVQFFRPGLRYFGPQALALFLLSLRALPLRRRPGLAALVLLVLGGGALVLSLPTVLKLHRLPHNHQVRAERLARHARQQDIILFTGSDAAYGLWQLPGRRVHTLWDLVPEERRRKLLRGEDYLDGTNLEEIANLLRQVLVPVVRMSAAHGLDVLVVPEPAQLPLFHDLAKEGLSVTVLERIPPGASILQGDGFGQTIGLGDPVSRHGEQVLRLRPAPE